MLVYNPKNMTEDEREYLLTTVGQAHAGLSEVARRSRTGWDTSHAKGHRSCGTWSSKRPGRGFVGRRTFARSTSGSVVRILPGRRSPSWPRLTICSEQCWPCCERARSGATRRLTGEVTAGTWPRRLPFQPVRASTARPGEVGAGGKRSGPRISCMAKAGRVGEWGRLEIDRWRVSWRRQMDAWTPAVSRAPTLTRSLLMDA